MDLFCDVALPVPLERLFTYSLEDSSVSAGVRVLVPFSGRYLTGVIVRVHQESPGPEIQVKPVQQVLEPESALPPDLMELAVWISQYYVAPLGEVLRGMLPLEARVKRTVRYRLTDAGRKALHEGAEKGSSRRIKSSPEQQRVEYAVLNQLEAGDAAKASALRSATGADKSLLEALVGRRWLIRETEAEERTSGGMERFAVLSETERLPRLNKNQTALLAALSAVGGRMRLRDLRQLAFPASTLGTLVRRGLVFLEAKPAAFDYGAVVTPGQAHAHEHSLNEEQTDALASIAVAVRAAEFHAFLLHGVTGSGKTAVYLAAMRRVRDEQRSALLLVPEIALTPAMVGATHAAFGSEVAVLHSDLTPDERAEQWRRIRRGEAKVIVGTRSAVFAPITNLGIILVDEEHDSSYKQGETPRYHGRDTAVMRAKMLGIPIVLGSATPSLESWSNVQSGKYRALQLTRRVADRPMPQVSIVDMRLEFRETGTDSLFSRQLLEEVQSTLDRGEQAVILLNRRGYSGSILCRSCGEKIDCDNCAISLTYHKPHSDERFRAHPGERLECHYCGFRSTVPQTCKRCGSKHLHYMGAGSQQGEERLGELFPAARIGRMDRDTIRGRGDMLRLLNQLHSGEINLLVGTQMIAKGHDIHGITTVGVVGCDHALSMPDFRAAERVFQLLTQVSGRAGRGSAPGRVLVQTYQPDHYSIRYAAEHDYAGFVQKEVQFRRWMHYPPHGLLANIIVQAEQQEEALGWTKLLEQWQRGQARPGLRIMGPAPAPIARLKRTHRYQFLMKAERRTELQLSLRQLTAFMDREAIPRQAVIIDVDPVHLM